MNQERASKKQQELLSFVDGFIKGNGYGPSYREIMRALGYKSVSTVAIHVEGLIAKGYLARRDKSARSLEIVSLRPLNSETPAESSDAPFEAQLRKTIDDAKLSSDQLRHVAESLVMIGLPNIAAAVAPKETHEVSA